MTSSGWAANVYRCSFCQTENVPREQLHQGAEGAICAACHERVGVILRRQQEAAESPPA